jgi:hypothetical protein
MKGARVAISIIFIVKAKVAPPCSEGGGGSNSNTYHES